MLKNGSRVKMKYKWLIDLLVLSNKWTSLGKYMIPNKIAYSSTLETGIGGRCSYSPFSCTIELRPKYKDDLGILKHEQAHARQYGRLFWLHSSLSMLSGWYRFFIELECYREQVKEYSYRTKTEYEWIIKALLEKYNLGIDENQVRMYSDYVFADLLKSNTENNIQ